MEQAHFVISIEREMTRMERLRARRRRSRMRLLALAVILAGAAVVYAALVCAADALEEPVKAEQGAPDQTAVTLLDWSETPAKETRKLSVTEEERELMARVVYLEARGEPAEGQQAVAEVILNRVRDARFPDTVAEVIYQDDPLQFTVSPLLDQAEPGEAQYAAVDAALHGEPVLPEDVLYFDTEPINENVWGTIGHHVFCGPYGEA